MSVGITGLKWLDLLESEFDKSFVDLDLLLGELEEEQLDVVFAARSKLTALSAAFAQLAHKAQLVCDHSTRLERELERARGEAVEARGAAAAAQKELQHLLLQLHSAQLQVSAAAGHEGDAQAVQDKLDGELCEWRGRVARECVGEAQLQQLRGERERLQQDNVQLQSEIFGARLAAKYLEKELAGRIQQLQLLGRGDVQAGERLWEQLEAEIHLHRHKTVIRACRRGKHPADRPPHVAGAGRRGVGEVREVTVERAEGEGLGISITGGREHCAPVVVSEVVEGGAAWRGGGLWPGDAILAVNGRDLSRCLHREAADILAAQQGEVRLEVVFVAPEEEAEGEEEGDLSFFFPRVCLVDRGTDPITDDREASGD